MAKTTTSVPIRGGREIQNALRSLAAVKGMPIADLVANAVDVIYGEELKPHLAFFAAQDGTSMYHSEHSITNKSK